MSTITSVSQKYCPDFIIIGGGAAGAIIAARLAEYLPYKNILLVEAGPSDFNDDRFLVMRRWFELVESEFDYNYPIEKQEYGNSEIRQSRAKVLGGCASHNTGLAFRPFDRDLADWQSLGADGWTPKTIGRCLDQLRTQYQPIDQKDRNQLFKDCVSACTNALGIPVIEDFNKTIKADGDIASGVGFFSVAYNPETGIRNSSSAAYLHPILSGKEKRTNLKILVETRALRVNLGEEIVDGVTEKRAISVDLKFNDDSLKTMKANSEIILCAGAIDTPRLLLLSGIGPAHELEKLQPPIVIQHDLPGVGENLQDHPEAVIIWELNQPMPKTTATDNDVGIFIDRYEDGVADIMIHTTQEPYKLSFEPYTGFPGYDIPLGYQFCMAPNMPRPRSRGKLWLTSSNPDDNPAIGPRYFSDPYDSQALVDGLRISRKIAAEEPFKKWLKCERIPGPKCVTDKDLAEYGRKFSRTVYHPCGTTKMGNVEIDKMAVVDARLKVKGVKGLRIADAGVFPTLTTINPMLTVYAVGERAAEIIVEDNGWKYAP